MTRPQNEKSGVVYTDFNEEYIEVWGWIGDDKYVVHYKKNDPNFQDRAGAIKCVKRSFEEKKI